MALKRILTMQDISCFGKCSVTIALPVISAAGAECVILPTALLSTHTGGLGEVHFRDLTDDILPIAAHWREIGIVFDGIYIGYLGSTAQIELAKEVIRMFRTPDNFVLLDPVMGDHGRLYNRFDDAYVAGMSTLVEMADYCVPNLTEAALLAGRAYPGEQVSPPELDELLSALAGKYPAHFIVTGIPADGEAIGAATLGNDTEERSAARYVTRRHDGRFHGTGDLFASVLAAALARGRPLADAIAVSVDFTAAVIARTMKNGTDERFGIDFESCLPLLYELLK